jgi:hypothetical protein
MSLTMLLHSGLAATSVLLGKTSNDRVLGVELGSRNKTLSAYVLECLAHESCGRKLS